VIPVNLPQGTVLAHDDGQITRLLVFLKTVGQVDPDSPSVNLSVLKVTIPHDAPHPNLSSSYLTERQVADDYGTGNYRPARTLPHTTAAAVRKAVARKLQAIEEKVAAGVRSESRSLLHKRPLGIVLDALPTRPKVTIRSLEDCP
jgi:hypothetical protein